ncbi:MAG: hypothetical protein LM556_00185 [Desulfurococcaceae archaeon]|jgi:UPF0148 protein|nr:hypothetical protein [Desulfurococcaceae archaeon]
MSTRNDPTKIMAELLKSGAVMLAETCPVEGCHLPLFKLKTGEVVCPVHGRVHIVKSEEEAKEIYAKTYLLNIIERLETYALRNIENLLSTPDIEPTEYIKWLEVLERIQRLKSQITARSQR